MNGVILWRINAAHLAGFRKVLDPEIEDLRHEATFGESNAKYFLVRHNCKNAYVHLSDAQVPLYVVK